MEMRETARTPVKYLKDLVGRSLVSIIFFYFIVGGCAGMATTVTIVFTLHCAFCIVLGIGLYALLGLILPLPSLLLGGWYMGYAYGILGGLALGVAVVLHLLFVWTNPPGPKRFPHV